MCQMRIIVKQGDHEEVFLENAALLKVSGGGVLVNALFEAPRLIADATISQIDFLESRVTVVKNGKQA